MFERTFLGVGSSADNHTLQTITTSEEDWTQFVTLNRPKLGIKECVRRSEIILRSQKKDLHKKKLINLP